LAGNQRLQGGVRFPTGGRFRKERARERFRLRVEGQQIRSDAGADGHSPDERRRPMRGFPAGVDLVPWGVLAWAYRGERFMFDKGFVAASGREAC